MAEGTLNPRALPAEGGEPAPGGPAPEAAVGSPAVADIGSADVHVAVRSAVILNLAMLATWAVASVVRFYLSRRLGPAAFGTFRSADATTTAWFILLAFGMETYIHKEIPVRPQHASDFFGGVAVVRAVLGGALLGALALGLWHRGASPEVWGLVLTFGLAQAFASTNVTLSAMLHASRNVAGMALVSVACKLIWGVGTALALWRGWSLGVLALPFLASELTRVALLAWLAHRHVGLRWRIDWPAVRAALGRSLPFYVNGVAIAVYSNVDTIVLSLVASPAEVGYYGAAQSVAGLSLFISPLIGSVLMPLLARAKARSREEMLGILRRSIELVIATILPVVLLVGLGADLWVRRLSGADYGPAAPALTLLAPMFVLTYLTILTATYLLLVDHAWTVTLVSCGSMAVAGALDLLVVPRTWAWLGTGGAGVGAAVAQTATEGLVTLIFLVTIGRGAFDRRSLGTLGKSLLIGGAVVALDLLLRPLGLVRLGLDAALFAALALLSGTVRVGEVRALISEQLQARFARARA